MSFVVEAIARRCATCRPQTTSPVAGSTRIAAGARRSRRGGRAPARAPASASAAPRRRRRRRRGGERGRRPPGRRRRGPHGRSLSFWPVCRRLRVELRVQRLELGERDAGPLRDPAEGVARPDAVGPPRLARLRLVGGALRRRARRALLGLRRRSRCRRRSREPVTTSRTASAQTTQRERRQPADGAAVGARHRAAGRIGRVRAAPAPRSSGRRGGRERPGGRPQALAPRRARRPRGRPAPPAASSWARTMDRDAVTRPPARPGREGRGEVLHAAALRADAGQQEGGARHQLAQRGRGARARSRRRRRRRRTAARRRRPARPAPPTRRATASQTVPPPREREVLDVGGAGVRGAHEHEHAGAGGAGRVDQDGDACRARGSGLAVKASAPRPATSPAGVGVAPTSAWP